MAVMEPREKWTDERLDDLNKKVDDGFADTKAEMRGGFARLDGDIKDLRREMNARFNSIDARFDKTNESTNARFDSTDARLDAINARFDALNRNLLAGVAAVITAVIGSNVL